jgi:hypothetical protein
MEFRPTLACDARSAMAVMPPRCPTLLSQDASLLFTVSGRDEFALRFSVVRALPASMT